MVGEEGKLRKTTMVMEKIRKVEEKMTMMVEDRAMKKAKIKLRKENAMFTGGLIMLPRNVIIDVSDVHTTHMLLKIVGTKEEMM